MEEIRNRHCWECFRRSLVCDFTRPFCKRCTSSGLVCPGFEEREPLRLKWLVPGQVKCRNQRLSSNIHRKENPPSISRFDTINDAPILAQAAEYFNACIYPDLVPISDLGPNPGIYRISPLHIQRGKGHPEFVQLGMVCMTLSHRINRMRNVAPFNGLTLNFFRYRGLAIRSLCSDISELRKCTSDLVIAGIITILLVDAQQGASPYWKCHIEGLQRLITLRGGIRSLVTSTHLQPLLHCFLLVTIFGDTSSPASDLAMASMQLEEIELMLEKFGRGTFAFQMCPTALFAGIIKINHLRLQAWEKASGKQDDMIREAYEILNRIQFFSPERWAESKPSSKEDWMVVGSAYQKAVALYCILSLQSLTIFPSSALLRACCTDHGESLQVLLSKALSSPRIKGALLWPLVILGVEAANSGSIMRAFVREQLPQMSHHIGSYVPLTAKILLERFWASGDTRWDACFDKPYALTTQIAVDLSQLS